jgi:Flp pilus assembly protein TadD
VAASDSLFKACNDPEAIMLYEKARTVDPKSQHVSRRLGLLYDRQGMHQKARDEYDRALSHAPNDPNLLNDMGYSCFARGMMDEAELHLSKAIATDPSHKRAWVNLGLVLGYKGRYADSLNAFEQAVSRPQAYSNLGFIYTTQGKKEEAKKVYRKALSLEPDMPLVHAALARLEGTATTAPRVDRSVGKSPRTVPDGVDVGEPAPTRPVKPAAASATPAASLEPVRANNSGKPRTAAVPMPPLPMRRGS